MTLAKKTFFIGAFGALAFATLIATTAPHVQAGDITSAVGYQYNGASIKAERLHPSANMSYKVAGKRYSPMKKVADFSQTGRASWYGNQFHGHRTSSGEAYNMNELTAAHKTLPIPSYAKVTNLANGKSVVVKINDRGPFHSGRVMDVSRAAAAKLGFLSRGTANVRIEQIVPGRQEVAAADNGGNVYVNLKSFDSEVAANSFAAQTNSHLSAGSSEKVSTIKQGGQYVVRMGPFNEQSRADSVRQSMQQTAI